MSRYPSSIEFYVPGREATPITWAIALHGGAGTLSRDIELAEKHAYEVGLSTALALGVSMLERGDDGLDVVEAVVRVLEDDPVFNAGRGAVLTADGVHELDASIMDGRNLACGAVSGLTTVRHPIALARKVMTESSHVFLSGEGAEVFGSTVKVDRVENSFFTTEYQRKAWELAHEDAGEVVHKDAGEEHGTVGVVVRDKNGHLGAGTSTGGTIYKRYGRVGDSPIIGAGTYADDRSVAVSCTGTGERFIEQVMAYQVAARIRFGAQSLADAVSAAMVELPAGAGGLIAVDRYGQIAMPFNTTVMHRAAADSTGRRNIGIWEEIIELS
ncbi:MAG: isoaspartyl peptidase/L-asparaginase [Myxococcales bacterium]|nr:isoaspartyl peptidase/L-asparaginase [Myxococcales bacterium]